MNLLRAPIIGAFVLILVSTALAGNLVELRPQQTHVCGCETTKFQVVVTNPNDYGKGYTIDLESDVKDWLSLQPKTLVVNENSSESLWMYIAVPCDAQPGTYDIGVALSSYDVSDSAKEQLVVRSDCTINVPAVPELPSVDNTIVTSTPAGLGVAATTDDFLKLGGAAMVLAVLAVLIIVLRK